MSDQLEAVPPPGPARVPADHGPGRPARPTGRRRVHLRGMREGDLDFVVDQHLEHFPNGFFARLGRGFLREYYRAFLTGPAACTTVAEMDGERVGYLVGVTRPGRQRDHVVRRHGGGLAARAAVAMLRRPWLALLFLRTRAVRYAGKLMRWLRPSSAERATPGAAVGVLTHVAVVPGAQSAGVGSCLVDEFETEAAHEGCERLVLVTASGERGAGRFYRRRGWCAREDHCTPDGQELTTYELALANDDQGPAAAAGTE